LATQYILVKAIQAKFPNDAIIAEEDLVNSTEDQKLRLQTFLHQSISAQKLPLPSPETRRFWTIDPIDGTKGYLRGGQYAICVALVVDQEVQLAFLACPRLPTSLSKSPATLFVAIRSLGVLEMSLAEGRNRRLGFGLRPSGQTQPILAESYESNHTDHQFSKTFSRALNLSEETVRMDSQCKYGIVARGDAHIYLRRPTKPGYVERIWDHAPGVLIVEEAGGTVTDFEGKRIVFAPEAALSRAGGILATNLPTGHSTVLAVLQAIENSK
jgi:3'(2'), 5'-bisphosphate nucleotidase